MRFGENLKKFRCKIDLTQEAFAQKLNISPQAVSKWERGESMPDPATLPMIASTLGVSLDRLFDHENEEFSDLKYHIEAYMKKHRSQMRSVRQTAYLASLMLSDESATFFGSTESGCDVNNLSHATAIITETGFTIGSNSAKLPFLCVFEEPADGWGASLCSADSYRNIFEELSRPGVIEAVLKIFGIPKVAFDESYAAHVYGISPETIEKLCRLKLLQDASTEINGESVTLYNVASSTKMIALLGLAKDYADNEQTHDTHANDRQTPLIR